MNFEKELKNKIEIINNNLDCYLEKKYPEKIYEAMRYSAFAGGKRLRPVLMLSACETVGGNIKEAIPFACALEMIHTYSLIHDDLPAMDNDDYRRGKLTCHKAFDEATAILAGDALLNLAYEIMINYIVERENKLKFLKAMQIITIAAGVNGMIGGQVVDIISEGKNIDESTLMYIHKNKTAALITAAVKAGAVIGDAQYETVLKFDEIGHDIGIAFQIKDDILDVTSSVEILGKPVFSDEKNKKTTYVTLHGIEKSKQDYIKLSNKAIALAENIGEDDEFFLLYLKKIVDRIN